MDQRYIREDYEPSELYQCEGCQGTFKDKSKFCPQCGVEFQAKERRASILIHDIQRKDFFPLDKKKYNKLLTRIHRVGQQQPLKIERIKEEYKTDEGEHLVALREAGVKKVDCLVMETND